MCRNWRCCQALARLRCTLRVVTSGSTLEQLKAFSLSIAKTHESNFGCSGWPLLHLFVVVRGILGLALYHNIPLANGHMLSLSCVYQFTKVPFRAEAKMLVSYWSHLAYEKAVWSLL